MTKKTKILIAAVAAFLVIAIVIGVVIIAKPSDNPTDESISDSTSETGSNQTSETGSEPIASDDDHDHSDHDHSEDESGSDHSEDVSNDTETSGDGSEPVDVSDPVESSDPVETSTGGDKDCEHEFTGWKTVKEPTCTDDGLDERECTKCGMKVTRTTNKLGHAFGAWNVTKNATCTEEGSRTHTCSRCNKTETETIPKTDHSFDGWSVTRKATCKEEGTKTAKCSVCGKTVTETIPKTSHDFGDYVVTKAATDTEEGVKTATCKICGEKQTVKIPKTGTQDCIEAGYEFHEYTLLNGKPIQDERGNYTEDFYKAMVIDVRCDGDHSYVPTVCQRCGKERARPYEYVVYYCNKNDLDYYDYNWPEHTVKVVEHHENEIVRGDDGAVLGSRSVEENGYYYITTWDDLECTTCGRAGWRCKDHSGKYVYAWAQENGYLQKNWSACLTVPSSGLAPIGTGIEKETHNSDNNANPDTERETDSNLKIPVFVPGSTVTVSRLRFDHDSETEPEQDENVFRSGHGWILSCRERVRI